MSNNDGIGIHRITGAQKVHVRNDDKAFTQMCKALGDEISLAIIKSTIEKSAPAIEIAKAHHVPLSSVYKKIRRLRELGVINIDKINVDDRSGKKITCYRSRVKAIQFSLAGSETTVRFEGNHVGGQLALD